jgi:hypothetical protein
MSTSSDADGWYEVPLPPVGRYIVTGLDPEGRNSASLPLVLSTRSAVIDIVLPAGSEMADVGAAGTGAAGTFRDNPVLA